MSCSHTSGVRQDRDSFCERVFVAVTDSRESGAGAAGLSGVIGLVGLSKT